MIRTMRGIQWVIVAMLGIGAAAAVGCKAKDGCGKDTDCKGARVCVHGECVEPTATAHDVAPQAAKGTEAAPALLVAPPPITHAKIVTRPCAKCSPGPQEWDVYPHGDVQLNDGRFLTTDGQAREASVSPDHATVGWVTGAHGVADHGETVLLSTDLNLWHAGNVTRIHRDAFIHDWLFVNHGKQVALATGPVRDARLYCLYDVATAALVESGPIDDYEAKKPKPHWVEALDKRQSHN
jgi:hypothetical protein